MKSQYRVVVIGGGVVLYHLAKLGWSGIALIERSVLTAGSSWHAAGGIRKWVNGAFTFIPDGNPLVGPARPGAPNYWAACGVMASFPQGGGVGKSLAEWDDPRRARGRHPRHGRGPLRRIRLAARVSPPGRPGSSIRAASR